MKLLGVIMADFERGDLGTRPRLNDDLLGETILRRTIRQALAARRLNAVQVAVPVAQEAACRAAVAGLEIEVQPYDAPPVPWQAHVTAARKWALDSWRGGVGGAAVFDESLHPWVLEAIARREGADAVALIPGAAALLDPALLDALIDHYEKVQAEVRMVFTQSAPGLSVAVYGVQLLADLMQAGHPIGRAMAYRPADPRREMTLDPCFMHAPPEVMHAWGRCILDTATTVERARAMLAELGGDNPLQPPDAPAISRWLDRQHWTPPTFPEDIEIELTTDDPLPQSRLRPRGSNVPRRGPMPLDLFRRLVEEITSARDDVRVTLGGFGDPLLHPQWVECVRLCRELGVFALAVRTPAVHLDDEAARVLAGHRVDVLNVLLDAASPETYARVHGADFYPQVTANIDRVFETQRQQKLPLPLVLCEMIKTADTMNEMEPFYDGWINRTGGAVIAGPSAYAGQWADLAVMDMSPPRRHPCRRIFNRAIVLADGSVPPCDQDFKGCYPVGNITDSPLAAIWTSPEMNRLRAAHGQGNYTAMPLCPPCREWHRP